MKLKIGALVIVSMVLAACQADTSLLEIDPEEVVQQAADLQASVFGEDDDSGTGENQEGAGNDIEDVDVVQVGETVGDAEEDNQTDSQEMKFEPVLVELVDLGDNWFQPVNPLEIDLSSGEYQLIDFSAFW